MTYFLHHDILSVLLEVLTYLLTWWLTFARYDVLLDVMMYFLTFIYFLYFLTTRHTFWHYIYLLTYSLMSRRTSWRHDLFFDTIKYLLKSWHTCWCHNVLFDSMMYFLILWHIFCRQTYFLAPPAERQRSFSNADSSVVVRPSSVRRPSSTFHLKY